jgi:hypothetical protein
MQRQKRLKQVWSSSIDTPEILRLNFKAERVVGPSPKSPLRF